MTKDPLLDKQVGNYRIIAGIGNGSFGNVYKAEHVYLKKRVVAIKLLHAGIETPKERERFMQEAHFLAALKHPHILSLLDCGFLDVGGFELPYQIAPFAEGGSLRDFLRQEAPLAVSQILPILSQVGQALQAAHQQKIIHRDLKPDNILFDAQGHVLLADFGIATALANTSVSLKKSEVIGTPLYMAPEQFQGIVSKEGDQYALGCIAYELFTGQVPFSAPDFISLGFKHVTELPIPPTQLNREILPGCEAAILKALAKQRADRHVSVEAFVTALLPPSTQVMTIPSPEQAGVGPLLRNQPPTEPQPTKDQWLKIGNERRHARHYEEAIAAYDQAIRLDPKNAVAYYNKGYALNELQHYEEALAALEQAIRLDPKNAAAYNEKGYALSELQHYEEALAALEQAIRLDPKHMLAYYSKGYALNELRRYEEALAALEQAIRLDPKNMLAYRSKGYALNELQRYEEALAAHEQAIRLDPKNAAAYNNKGYALNKLQRYEEALAALEQAIRLDPKHAVTYNEKGYSLEHLGRYREAEQTYQRAREVEKSDRS